MKQAFIIMLIALGGFILVTSRKENYSIDFTKTTISESVFPHTKDIEYHVSDTRTAVVLDEFDKILAPGTLPQPVPILVYVASPSLEVFMQCASIVNDLLMVRIYPLDKVAMYEEWKGPGKDTLGMAGRFVQVTEGVFVVFKTKDEASEFYEMLLSWQKQILHELEDRKKVRI